MCEVKTGFRLAQSSAETALGKPGSSLSDAECSSQCTAQPECAPGFCGPLRLIAKPLYTVQSYDGYARSKIIL